ncbi:pyruvate carboxylase subunit B [Veillonella sp.]|uniref:pyruvate carboxylase subunit B n=1 Tax=Veillonella sp. TaxID=1926307 RepID=UPI0029068E36|nr:pyruvate carboxylase subunit B [Veillonella sp.]MDU4115191.1 pyruvate carboxylase subunit B [Veillonella sp.]
MAKKLRICETVLRDGHQSILATRMRYEQMEPVLGLLDDIGYEALECWGGATYDSCLRFLNEDPWERLRKLKANLKNTPLQMLLRGQNLLGYKHYSDDVVEAFCNAAVKNGIDRIRIFDALNDPRNMEAAIKYSKKAGAHVQSAMVYTISPVHTTESFLKVAETLVEMGTDSLCIKDMSGLLGPADAYDLVSTFKKRFGELPIDLHSHFTCGLASTTYWEAAKAGVDIIDTAISPFAHATSQPATETMIEMFKGTEWDLGLDLDKYIPLVDHFRKVKQQIAEEFNLKPASDVIPAVRRYQIPGGMLSNTQNQLNEMGMGDRFFDVMDEMPRVREDLGYPPLVTPTSQIVGTMAMMNVMMGDRYKMVPNEVKEYGQLPGTISDEIRQTIIGDEQPITCRPADLIEPELEGYRQDLASKGYNGITDEDVLTYAMFPEVAINFFDANRR